MLSNMGKADRVLRGAVIAPLLIVAAVVVGASSVVGIVLLALAAIMLATAAVGSCPLYRLARLSTNKHAQTS